jgi:hypothetical protein
MTTERIKEIQAETGYPDSVSVQQALLKVWNECEQERVKNCNTTAVSKSVEPVREPTVCSHPREYRTYIGRNTLRCGLCGLEFE